MNNYTSWGTSELISQLSIEQDKLRAIHKLSNCIHKVSASEAKDIAHFIHKIIESDTYSTDIARELMSWQLRSNKDMFMTAK